jgi:hypothetical protein
MTVDQFGEANSVKMIPDKGMYMVRAEGLEPSRTLWSNGFSYPLRLSPPPTAFRNGVWGLDYPFTAPGFGSGCQVLPV